MDIRKINEVPALTTKDGSEIRELLAYRNSCIKHQSLAEARLKVGAATIAHYHPKTEEIYYLLAGQGRMDIDGELCDVEPGDAIAIPPGAKHQITNIGDVELKLLCTCVPAYEDSDTVMVDSTRG